MYCLMHHRICRPVDLSEEEIYRISDYLISSIGYEYDFKNIFDLARYFIQRPPVPAGKKRRLLALGSGDPTRVICTSLIAQAFQSVNYPILPQIEIEEYTDIYIKERYKEILHIRHHSLIAPRDFDVSSYFKIVKPSIESDFDPELIEWERDQNTKRNTILSLRKTHP